MKKRLRKERAYAWEGPLERVREYPTKTCYHSCIYQPHIYSALHQMCQELGWEHKDRICLPKVHSAADKMKK